MRIHSPSHPSLSSIQLAHTILYHTHTHTQLALLHDINAVLISTPEGLLGLPLLMRRHPEASRWVLCTLWGGGGEAEGPTLNLMGIHT